MLEKYGGEGSALVVVNDGSKDSTFEKLCSIAGEKPKLIPLDKKNGGHGSAVLCGYRYAIRHGADLIFQTDSDGQTDPRDFARFWKRIRKADAVIGFRPKRGDGFLRKVVEDIVCLILRVIFGVKVKDANAPFRMMKTELVEKYISRLPENYNLPNIMFTTYFVYYRENTAFLPISFKPRQGGKTSINLKKIFVIGRQAMGDFLRFRKEMRKDV